ncbi:MAG: ABC transporter substrate-binding protein [Thiolinea sp.]
MQLLKKALLASALSAALFGSAHAAGEVEVLHWWTSGGEAKALNVLKEDLESQGITWKDMPVAGGGGEQAMTVLRSRVAAGNPPTAVQMLGFDIQDWAAEGATANLDGLATAEKWDEVVPPALQRFSKYDGHWVAAPVNVHSTNWVWANKQIMDELGVDSPIGGWEHFVDFLDKAKAKGYTALAHGGQPWQDATLFDSVVLATGGADFYKKSMIDLDPEALGSDTMKTVFDRMKQLRGYVDDNFSGRDWNLASAMATQAQCRWVTGPRVNFNAGKKPGEDFNCFRFPNTQGMVFIV